MSTLVLDFSSRQLVCAICKDGVLIKGGLFLKEFSSGDQLPDQLRRLTDGISIHRIVLGNGPGSYTGLRISCAVAQAFGYCRQLPIFPVCTLKGLLPINYSQEEYLLIAMSGRSRYHSIRFDARTHRWGQSVMCSLEEIDRILQETSVIACSSSELLSSSSSWQKVELNPLVLAQEANCIGLYPGDLYKGLELYYAPEPSVF